MSEVKLLLASLLGEREVVSFRPALARALGAVPALFLCQACYWQGIAGAYVWWYKLRDADRDAAGGLLPPENASRQSWEWELGLTRAEQEGARRVLRQRGLLEEALKGVPAKLHYRVNLDCLSEFLLKNQQMAEFNQLDGEIQPPSRRNTAGKPGRIPPAITETTAEISTSTTTTALQARSGGGIDFNKLEIEPVIEPYLSQLLEALQSAGIADPILAQDLLDELAGTIEAGDRGERAKVGNPTAWLNALAAGEFKRARSVDIQKRRRTTQESLRRRQAAQTPLPIDPVAKAIGEEMVARIRRRRRQDTCGSEG